MSKVSPRSTELELPTRKVSVKKHVLYLALPLYPPSILKLLIAILDNLSDLNPEMKNSILTLKLNLEILKILKLIVQFQ